MEGIFPILFLSFTLVLLPLVQPFKTSGYYVYHLL
jgi:hypothetical protein